MYGLRANNLSKRFGARKVFSGIEFELTTGDVIAVVGDNGSGKTTLVKTLLGEYRPTKGEVVFSRDGKPLGEEGIRENASLVAPYLNLYDSLSGEENLVFFAEVAGLTVTGKEINALLCRLGLEGRGSDQAGAYSSGMKQRLKYAVALLSKPNFLFLDEPTSNLDNAGKKIVYEIIEEYRDRAVVVVATNEAEDQKIASTICRITG
jgi:heme exporter protein A